jgi:site-specific recombinase XerC
LRGYDRSLRHVLIPEFGARPAAALDALEWQSFVDRLAKAGLSRSRIANHLAVVRAIYSWASRPTRRFVPGNPTIGVELPPVDEVPRDRAATADEAAALLRPLSADDRLPFALAFYAGFAVAKWTGLPGRMSTSNGFGSSCESRRAKPAPVAACRLPRR